MSLTSDFMSKAYTWNPFDLLMCFTYQQFDMYFHDADFLYSISREHIKYISIFLTWTCLSWREGFLVCTFNESLFGPAFLFVWSQYKRCCYVIKADACSFRTLKIILYVLMQWNWKLETYPFIRQNESNYVLRWLKRDGPQNSSKTLFIQPIDPRITFNNTMLSCVCHYRYNVCDHCKKYWTFYARIAIVIFFLLCHVRMKQIRSL